MKINESSYKMVKAMLAGGAKVIYCADYTGLSTYIVSNIKNSKDFDDYKQIIRQKYENRKENIAKTKENIAIEKTHSVPSFQEEIQMLKKAADKQHQIFYHASSYDVEVQIKTNQLLEQINKKLAFIIKELTGKESEV